MPDQGSITQWIGDLRDGRSAAAGKLWERYFGRLVGLARKKLRDTPRRMADEEDVVVNAFQSFCAGAAEGRFPKLGDRDDLWQVLVVLTARKAADQMKHQFRQKRGGGVVRGESVFIEKMNGEERALIDQVVGSEPTPEFAAQLTEECGRLLDLLNDETLRAVAIARMEGYSNDEIAAKMGVKTRTIERKLNLIRELWSQQA
ncbi:MAG: ECF-type sigma factor [Pirellulaceae bacterium]|nr:ECF-type sigma factor [Pirellulaceae bacterium]